MPAPTKTQGRTFFWCLSGLVTLWLLGFFTTKAMESIPSPFTIEIDGKPIAQVHGNAEDRTQAKLGKEAAVFSLKNSRLRCGEWIMGRNFMENRSLGPKKLSWYKANPDNEKQVQPVTATKEGETYQLSFPRDLLLVDDDDIIWVDLFGESQSKVKIILQET